MCMFNYSLLDYLGLPFLFLVDSHVSFEYVGTAPAQLYLWLSYRDILLYLSQSLSLMWLSRAHFPRKNSIERERPSWTDEKTAAVIVTGHILWKQLVTGKAISNAINNAVIYNGVIPIIPL